MKDGLSASLPGAGQPGLLTRGPTPAGDSVTPTRTPVRIVSATAGAALESAANAFDDNEETGWGNDDQRATAWMEFELERPALVSELVMKMGGWRRKYIPSACWWMARKCFPEKPRKRWVISRFRSRRRKGSPFAWNSSKGRG